MRSKRTQALAALIFLAASTAAAEDIAVSVRVNRHTVPVGGRVQLDLQITGTQNVPPPQLNFDGFQTQYLGPSTQVSIANGVMSSSVAHMYLLSPLKEGNFTLGPIHVEVNGKSFETQPIPIQVVSATRWRENLPPKNGQEETPVEQAGGDLQLQLSVDRARAYLNQTVPVKLQLLVGGVAVRNIEMPALQAEGFTVKSLGRPVQSEVIIGNQPYTLLEFRAQAIPLKTGNLVLGPASLNCQLLQRNARQRATSPFSGNPFEGMFDEDFPFQSFFGSARLVPVTLRADAVAVEVLPLPQEGKPDYFGGSVGEFSLDASITPAEVAVGEPVTLTMTVRGEDPEVVAAPVLAGDTSHFKLYPPQEEQARLGGQAADEKVFRQTLIPLDTTVTETPGIRFAFFNPKEGKYQTLTRGPFPLRVKAASAAGQPAVVQQPQQPPVAPAAKPPAAGPLFNIDNIREHPEAFQQVGRLERQSKSRLRWLFILLPAGLIAAVCVWTIRRSHSDGSGIPNASSAFKRAAAQCRKAQQLGRAGKTSKCYEEIFQALSRYISDRFRLAPEALTSVGFGRLLKSQQAPEELIRTSVELLDRCESARFAPQSAATLQVANTVDSAFSVLKQLEQWKP